MILLYTTLVSHFTSLFVSPNYNLLDNKSKWENNIVGVEIGRQYREDRKSLAISSIEHTGKNVNDVFRFKAGMLVTSAGSFALSFGTSKDIFITKKFFFSTHFMPSIIGVKNDDKKNSASGLKFNVAMEGGYMLTENLSLSIQWRHMSDMYTYLPNVGIDSIGVKLKFAF